VRQGAYPGSFNPPTPAHLAIAAAVVADRSLERIDFIVSRVALAKEHVDRPLFEHRVAALRDSVASRPWADVVITDHQLLADIADGYDVLVMGADKWEQVNDPTFYGGSVAARDVAIARLPELAVVGRPPHVTPEAHRLDVVDATGISSTRARQGATDHMTPAAGAFDRLTGAWSDPERYERWLEAN